ncbi:MAG TPA: hypothetical protein VMI31_00645, partial [Fimbriimonadaceae bacterium]|nr:hypothetical protein [Fimbriimonadaceae bacterium]
AANRARPDRLELYSNWGLTVGEHSPLSPQPELASVRAADASHAEIAMIFEDSPHKGHFDFGDEEVLRFEPDPVAGHWLCRGNGARLARQAPAWKESELARGVKLTSTLVDENYPWPQTGIALALLSVIHPPEPSP